MYLSNISRRSPRNSKKFINSRYFLKNIIVIRNGKIFKIYIQLNFLGTLVDIAQREKMPPICWENHGKSDNFPIHSECHQGRDRNIAKKQKYKETRKDLVRGVDHTQHIKTRKL